MLKLTDVTKYYHTDELETTALNKVNLEILEKDFIGIMGPSGCGKSTLLNVIGLLDTYDEGTYTFKDTAIHNLNEKERTDFRKENIGFIFQNFHLIDELSVEENIELPLKYLSYTKSERDRMVLEAMDHMNITHRRKHFPQQLSGGQQQRVAISRAVVTKPKLLLADEPTGNLDSKNGDEVMKLITDLNKVNKTTIIMVSHSNHDIEYCSKKVTLSDGCITNIHENISEAVL